MPKIAKTAKTRQAPQTLGVLSLGVLKIFTNTYLHIRRRSLEQQRCRAHHNFWALLNQQQRQQKQKVKIVKSEFAARFPIENHYRPDIFRISIYKMQQQLQQPLL